MINYFNYKKINNEFLLTNDFGKYAFLSADSFRDLIVKGDVNNQDISNLLINNKFIYKDSLEAFVNDNAYLIKDAKEYLFHPTQLHIFVVTNSCNMQCVYCQAQNGKVRPNGYMNQETARRAVDIALQSPADVLQFEFQGGEPLLNFDVIKFIVEYSQSVCKGKKIEYSLVSNLTLLTDEILEFIKLNNISISTSLDGETVLHDSNRPYRNGTGTFDDVKKSIANVKDAGLYIGALETTTKNSLRKAREIVDTYLELGFDSISLRPLTPLGCANKEWDVIGYQAEEFVEFYREALEYILEINQQKFFREGISSIFLGKILQGRGVNYMELRSPCGAALGQIAYYYDGSIYTCDEGRMVSEMGDKSFCLGNIYESDYNSLMDCDVCRIACSSSILESLPSCSICAYQPYCGVCPVVNYALDRDVFEKTPNNYRCKINKGMLDIIFSKLQRDDSNTKEIFWRWLK